MSIQTTPVERNVPKITPSPVPERIELTEAEHKFVAECEAAYEANPNELYTWEEVVAYIKRKK
jgi:hypothetical protein